MICLALGADNSISSHSILYMASLHAPHMKVIEAAILC